MKVEVECGDHQSNHKNTEIHRSNFIIVQVEGHRPLSAASDRHNHYDNLPNCPCSPSNILTTPASFKDFIAAVRIYRPAEMKTPDLWKSCLIRFNILAIYFVG